MTWASGLLLILFCHQNDSENFVLFIGKYIFTRTIICNIHDLQNSHFWSEILTILDITNFKACCRYIWMTLMRSIVNKDQILLWPGGSVVALFCSWSQEKETICHCKSQEILLTICQKHLTLLPQLLNQYGKLEDLTERYSCWLINSFPMTAYFSLQLHWENSLNIRDNMWYIVLYSTQFYILAFLGA